MLEPLAASYDWPATGGNAELRSLAAHAQLRDGLRDDMPIRSLRTRMMETALEVYQPACWSIPDDFLTRAHFLRVVENLDWTSSPGYPWLRMATNNRQFFKYVDGVGPDPYRLEYVWNVVQQYISEAKADPIRLFIKQEPTKVTKLAKDKARLISSVSVIDQIIDHMLFDPANQALVEACLDVPSKVGWSQYMGGWKIMPSETWLAADKSAWDWTVMPWILELILELRTRLCETKGELLNRWTALATQRYRLLFQDCVFVNSSGLLFKQNYAGVMKSGCVNTIADNSMAQYLLHLRVCFELGIDVGAFYCMGDDTLQTMDRSNVSEYCNLLAQFCVLKESHFSNEFAGSRFYGRRIEPLYRGKHAWKLLHVNDEYLQELAFSYQLLYHRSRYAGFIELFFSHLGANPVDKDFLDVVYDGE